MWLIKKTFKTIALLLLVYSCISEDLPVVNDADSDGFITVTVKTPGFSALTTYSGALIENEISIIDVLVFRENNFLLHHAEGYDLITDGEGITTFRLALPVNLTNRVYLVVLANYSVYMPNVIPGHEKSQVLNSLTFDTSNEWPTGYDNGPALPIPMWGESNIFDVSDVSNRNIYVSMLRSLAKINVTVTEDINTDNFELSSVHVYNANEKAHMARITDLATPSIPNVDVSGNIRLTYEVISGNESDNEIIDRIYLAEAYENQTCLVIGGYYNGETEPTYYRVDFKDVAGNYLALLRNYIYNVKITTVIGSGAATPEEALEIKEGLATVTITIDPTDPTDPIDITDPTIYINYIVYNDWSG